MLYHTIASHAYAAPGPHLGVTSAEAEIHGAPLLFPTYLPTPNLGLGCGAKRAEKKGERGQRRKEKGEKRKEKEEKGERRRKGKEKEQGDCGEYMDLR